MRVSSGLLVVPVAVFLAGSAFAATPYDGVYSGTLKVSGTSAKVGCPTQQVSQVTVRDGKITGPGTEQSMISGFVNEKAFITGKMKDPNGHEVAIQGRAEEMNGAMHLSAGAADDASGCAWTIDLSRQ